MSDTPPRYAGLWLPLVTPFKDGELDEASLHRLACAYAGKADGFVLCATTGEGMALSPDETRRVVALVTETLRSAASGARVMIGLSGASTAGVIESLRAAEPWGGDAYLISCPHYVRPSQEGLRLHFEAIADSTDADLIVYNIPYRTGVNLANDTLLRLAERRNIVGLKDCCADREQTRELVRRKPADFAVLMGDDASLGAALEDGVDGGIVASAHVDPEGFLALQALAQSGRRTEISGGWEALSPVPDLLFAEPNPAPLKHCLWRMGLIDSPELRLPLTPVGADLARRLDLAIAAKWCSFPR